MSQMKRQIEELDRKIELLAKQMKEIMDLLQKVGEHERKIEGSMFWRGLIVGVLAGIWGDYFVSYLMKVHGFFDYPFWIWLASTIVVFFGILILVIYMWKKSNESPLVNVL